VRRPILDWVHMAPGRMIQLPHRDINKQRSAHPYICIDLVPVTCCVGHGAVDVGDAVGVGPGVAAGAADAFAGGRSSVGVRIRA
jgi:hypothetical protein